MNYRKELGDAIARLRGELSDLEDKLKLENHELNDEEWAQMQALVFAEIKRAHLMLTTANDGSLAVYVSFEGTDWEGAELPLMDALTERADDMIGGGVDRNALRQFRDSLEVIKARLDAMLSASR